MPPSLYSDADYRILDYIENNPGTNKEAVIREMEKEHVYSRVTTLKRITQFCLDGQILQEKENQNSQVYRLYKNQKSESGNILSEIREFQRTCFIFFRELESVYNSKHNNEHTPEQENLYQMTLQTGVLVYVIINWYWLLSRRQWPRQIKSKESLEQLYANAFMKLANFQMKLLEYEGPQPLKVGLQTGDGEFFFPEGHLYYKNIRDFGLEDPFIKLLNSAKSIDLREQFADTDEDYKSIYDMEDTSKTSESKAYDENSGNSSIGGKRQ